MKRWLIIWCLLFGFSTTVFSQTLEMEDLRKNRERTLKELNETNKKLNKTLKSAKNSLNELNSITAENGRNSGRQNVSAQQTEPSIMTV